MKKEFILISIFVLGIVTIFWLQQYCNSTIDSIVMVGIVCGVVLLLIDILYNSHNLKKK